MTPWISQIFDARAAEEGGVVRRSVRDVEKFASISELLAEVRQRNFHLIQTGDQFVVICNAGELKIYC